LKKTSPPRPEVKKVPVKKLKACELDELVERHYSTALKSQQKKQQKVLKSIDKLPDKHSYVCKGSKNLLD
jgi:hypothetical protein